LRKRSPKSTRWIEAKAAVNTRRRSPPAWRCGLSPIGNAWPVSAIRSALRMSYGNRVARLRPGIRRAGLPRQSPVLTPGSRRHPNLDRLDRARRADPRHRYRSRGDRRQERHRRAPQPVSHGPGLAVAAYAELHLTYRAQPSGPPTGPIGDALTITQDGQD